MVDVNENIYAVHRCILNVLLAANIESDMDLAKKIYLAVLKKKVNGLYSAMADSRQAHNRFVLRPCQVACDSLGRD